MSKRKRWSEKRSRELQQWAETTHAAERIDQSVAWADPTSKEPDIFTSFTDYRIILSERQVANLKASQESGRYGNKRKPKTIKE
jgi:hypothetical protein